MPDVKIVHLQLPNATRYDQTCASIDASATNGITHEVFEATTKGLVSGHAPVSFKQFPRLLLDARISIVHLHGTKAPSTRLLAGLPIPWISDRPVHVSHSLFRKVPQPAAVLLDRSVPEAVPDLWFAESTPTRRDHVRKRVGTYVRDAESKNARDQAFARIQRFRDDIDWIAFERAPDMNALCSLDLWVDPAAGEHDLDGMVPEALACLTPVVASRTSQNARRLDDGKAGILVPVGDHNELTHAVLKALFKEEVTAPIREYARQFRECFRSVHRQRAVCEIYREIGR